MGGRVEFRILGTVEVIANGRAIDLGAPMEKGILARLLLDEGRIVSLERLIDDLWEGEPPESANVSVRVRVSKLRKSLAGAGATATIRTAQPGYAIDLGPEDTLDVAEFHRLHLAGRAAEQSGDHSGAMQIFDEALALWRGPALSGIGDPPFSRAETARLDEGRLSAIEDRIESALAAGRHSDLVAELETLVSQNPLRERLWAQRMTALYRSGRQADALAAFQDLRKILQEQLGLDPSPELSRLEGQILAQAPEISLRARQRDTALPSGVVTFLLTDIEGSTELWDKHPKAMPEVLQRHDQIVARVIADAAGHLIKSKGEGDATLSVFRRATDAVAAALDLHQALADESWRDQLALRVRVAIHTGEAHERDGDYFGPAVNRAARVRALASGGQILLSQVAAELVRDALPVGSSLSDLGERTLRGLARAEHVFELLPEGVEAVSSETQSLAPSRPALPDAILVQPGSQFVGRELELERLGSELKNVSAGGLRAIFAAGEPGIGKTRLCAEFARTAYEQGAVVLYGRCDEEPLVPYQPFVEALRRWASALTPTERQSVPGVAYLAPVVAELADIGRPLPQEDPEVARYKFFEAVASALEHASKAGSVLFILDDLHWADRPTLQLLQHIVRTRASTPILALGTYRETDLSRTRPLAEAIPDFRRERNFDRIALEGLDEQEILALLERAASQDIGGTGKELAHALSKTTDGNPFFIEQILGNLIDTGRLVLRDGMWSLDAKVEDLGIPEGVIEAVGRRLSRLTDSCNVTLAAASVLGRDFELDVLTRVVERDPDEVLVEIEQALDVGLVRELRTRGKASFTFAHALVQQALYEELRLARKQRLHLKAAAAIEVEHASNIDPYVTSLARHLREAGAAADPVKAIDYSARAMDVAARVFAFEEGIEHGEAALELIDEHGVEGTVPARLHERLGDMHYVAGREYEKSFGHYEAALAAYGSLKDQPKIARVHLKYGRGLATFVDHSDINKSLDHLHAAEEIVGPTPDPRIAAPLALGLSAASIYHLDIHAGLESAERAIQIGRELGSESIISTGIAFKAWALGILGRLDETDELFDEAWTIADRLDNVLAAFAAAWIRCNQYPRDPKEHARLALIELEKPRQAQTIMPRNAMRSALAGALVFAGDAKGARELTDASATQSGMGFGRTLLAQSFEQEERLFGEILGDIQRKGRIWIWEQLTSQGLGVMQFTRGASDLARESFESALAVMSGQARTDEFQTNARLAILEGLEHNFEKAAVHLAGSEQILSQGNGWRGYLGIFSLARAICAAGRLEEATPMFSEAIDIYRTHGLPFGEAEALHMWGRTLSDSDPARAAEKFDGALEIYTSRSIGQAWIDQVKKDRSLAI
ncbi:MAG: BTAD domain-containing putative transcriptional regulator [Actinomycetota bacterium]